VTNFTLDPDQAPYLLGDPFSEPPERARGIWKTLARAMEKLDRLRNQQAAYDIEAGTSARGFPQPSSVTARPWVVPWPRARLSLRPRPRSSRRRWKRTPRGHVRSIP
jgi:hypothetical protein